MVGVFGLLVHYYIEFWIPAISCTALEDEMACTDRGMFGRLFVDYQSNVSPRVLRLG
jgi:hypothetical protein